MLDYASLFDPRSEDDEGAFTLTRPDRRWDALRADWKEGTEWPDLFGPHDPFTLTDGVGQGATNRRADVAKVETLLGAAGYHDLDRTDGPTGYWGETLNQSIRRFQKDRDLDIDGYLRPKGETITSLKGLLGSSTAEKGDEGSLSITDCFPKNPPMKPLPPPDPWLEAIKDIREAFDGLIGWFDWGLGHDDAETRRRFTAFLDRVAGENDELAQSVRQGLAKRKSGRRESGRRVGDSFVYRAFQPDEPNLSPLGDDPLTRGLPTIASGGKFWNFLTGRWQDLPADFEKMLRKTESLFGRDGDYVLHANGDETAPETKKKAPLGDDAPVSPSPTPAPPAERSAGTSPVDKPDETARGNPDATAQPNPGADSKPLPPMPPVVGLDADVSTRPQLPPEAALYGGSNQAPSPDRFENFFRQLQEIEKEYSNNPNDSGRETNHGVKLKTFNDYLKDGMHRDQMPTDIKDLTKEQAKTIIREFFYDPLKIDQIRDDQIARQVFDSAILSGGENATKWLQQELANKLGSDIKDDGVLGTFTRQVLNAATPTELAAIAAGMAKRREEFINELVQKRPKNEDFIRGWIDRARPFGIWRPMP